jgi:hypothetical protein
MINYESLSCQYVGYADPLYQKKPIEQAVVVDRIFMDTWDTKQI